MRNICLIGYRGTGKSTLGKLLAARIKFRFVDTDDEIEQRAGMSIAEIFERHGEATFRDLESEVISDLTRDTGVVLSLGGGAILREANRDRIRTCGLVIWLQASVATIAQRIQRDPSSASRRPGLTSQGSLAEIEEVLSERSPLYEACASIQLDTDRCAPQELVDRIIDDCHLAAG